jgi:photosystem II stability/assembly factor-like uncharacterized protein
MSCSKGFGLIDVVIESPLQLGKDDPSFTLVRFTDKNHGWLAGRDSLYRTEDAGTTWTQVLTAPPAH